MPERTDVPASHAALFRSWQRARYQKQQELYGWEPPAAPGPDLVPPELADPPVHLAPPGEPPVVDWPDTDPPVLSAFTVSESEMPGRESWEPAQFTPLDQPGLAADWDNTFPDLGELPESLALAYLRDCIQVLGEWAARQVAQGKDTGTER